MTRILFVDDERQVLDGFRDTLRVWRPDWTMAFALSGEAAIAELAKGSFDVIVSDLRMPGMSGGELLQHVHATYPATVRIVLSGHSELEDTLHAAPFAHQFLAKPCPPDELHRVIEHLCGLQRLLADESLRSTVARVTSLPAAPAAYRRFAEAVANPRATTAELGTLIEGDAALFAKLLQLVNSSFFGLPRRITSGREAVSYLGLTMLRNLVLSVDLFRTFAPAEPFSGASVAALERHAVDVALCASHVAPREVREDAVAAGLLHDVGKLVLISRSPAEFASLALESIQRGEPLHVVERERLGVTHAEVGAYLLGLWGLPYMLVDAVARHHLPESVVEFDAAGVVAVANVLVNERDGQPVCAATWAGLERSHHDSLGEWRRGVRDASPLAA
jgi:HD-like signal output (HDOD) protein